jgi:hypothetical protein
MIKTPNPTIIITALCISCALIAFARYVPAVAYYFAAPVICLLPVVYALLRQQVCRTKL